MRRLLGALLVGLAVLSPLACKKKGPKGKKGAVTRPGVGRPVSKGKVLRRKVPVKKPVVVRAPLLTPDRLNPSKPIPVMQLKKAFFAWKGKQVTVTGYCKTFFDKVSLKHCYKITGVPKGKTPLFECRMKNATDEKVGKDTTVTVTGKLGSHSFWGVKLKNCRLVKKGGKLPAGGRLDPRTVDPRKPLPARALFQAVHGWVGKKVTVAGYYQGTTTSVLKSGNTYRVDISNPKRILDIGVGCMMKNKPPAKIKNRNILMRGTIKGEVFGRVHMVDCEFAR